MQLNTCSGWLRSNFYKFLPAEFVHVRLHNLFQGPRNSDLLLVANEGLLVMVMVHPLLTVNVTFGKVILKFKASVCFNVS